jgi:hypothetical protein
MKFFSQCLFEADASGNDEASGLHVIQQLELHQNV